MPAPRKTSEQQMEILITFMEDHRGLARGQNLDTASAKVATKRQWHELAALLNGQAMGVSKTSDQWRDYWRDIKYRVKKKAGEREVDRRRTGGGPPSRVELSSLEERILAIIGDRSVVGDNSVRIPFDDLDEEVPQPTLAIINDPPSPIRRLPLPEDAPLSSEAPMLAEGQQMMSPAHPQPSTSRAPLTEESPSAAATGAILDSPAPASKRRKTSGKSNPVEIPCPQWAWDAEQRRVAVDERRLGIEERTVAVLERLAAQQACMAAEQARAQERMLLIEERMTVALESIAGDLAAIRQGLELDR